MTSLLNQRLALLQHQAPDLLRECRHGIEKESLRIRPDGTLAMTAHPAALGAALTHSQITTDYSEALLEFITDAHTTADAALVELDAIHRFTYGQLANEQLWTHSMPCKLPSEADIPIAQYGSSAIGQLKSIYRQGLAVRYGKAMQCIAGIHYNFSLPEALWPLLQQAEGDAQPAQQYQSQAYIDLIRNFRRYSWLLMYLFGASPAVCASFLQGRPHGLDQLDEHTLYLPYATSLRMSDLGYQNSAQASLTPCYEELGSYLDSLRHAVSTPYPTYEAIGTKKDGQWQQLNTNLLQIENEYYSNIRPKRVAASGERPLQALRRRGVQYVEVRCLDINPFLPLGIDSHQAHFLDSFLLFCALSESPSMDGEECREASANFALTVKQGRRPGLLLNERGRPRTLRDWGESLCDQMEACAIALDSAYGGHAHHEALSLMRQRLCDPALTPSAQVLSQLKREHCAFFTFACQQASQHAADFRDRPLDNSSQAAFVASAQASLKAQTELEAQPQPDMDSFVAAYIAQLD
ncbi:glutamate--cysteine ligase [Atopomonas sediminilitoris]|uniref:glutamate--cysteine ligase n=1 Tax=Atopomonas sediminilitoris TaxID=2919919 RepID=UPI001F4E96F7|nr:glutamate--cysteine ligase [Atopomonas sediminilitoris]